MPKMVLTDTQLRRIQQIETDVLCEVDRICQKHQIKYGLGFGTLIGAVRHQGFIPWDDDVDICMMRKDYERFKDICRTELNPKYFYQSKDTDPEYYHLFDKIRVNGTVFKEDLIAEHDIHLGVYIDIFPMDYVPDNGFLRCLQFWKFHFFRTGLMAKYMSMEERTGYKLLAAKVVRALFKPFSLDSLYRNATREACRYDGKRGTYIFNFCSAINEKSLCHASCLEDVVYAKFEDKEFLIPKEYDEVLRVAYGDYMQLPPEEDRVPHHHLTELKI